MVAGLASVPPPYSWRTAFLCATGKLVPVAHHDDVRHDYLWFQMQMLAMAQHNFSASRVWSRVTDCKKEANMPHINTEDPSALIVLKKHTIPMLSYASF